MSPDPPEPPVVDPLVEVVVPPPVLVPPPSFRIPANQDSNRFKVGWHRSTPLHFVFGAFPSSGIPSGCVDGTNQFPFCGVPGDADVGLSGEPGIPGPGTVVGIRGDLEVFFAKYCTDSNDFPASSSMFNNAMASFQSVASRFFPVSRSPWLNPIGLRNW